MGLPVRYGWYRSAANTPICHVTEDSTRMIVLTVAKGTLSSCVSSAQRGAEVLRRVK